MRPIYMYMCVCRLTLQCWIHVCYDVRGLAALLRIDTYDITISGFNLNLWPLLNVLEECSLIPYLYILCILACVCEFFFCISLYISIETPYHGLVALPKVLFAIWLIMFPTRSKRSSRISKRLQKEMPSQRERQPPRALNKLPSWVKTTQKQVPKTLH